MALEYTLNAKTARVVGDYMAKHHPNMFNPDEQSKTQPLFTQNGFEQMLVYDPNFAMEIVRKLVAQLDQAMDICDKLKMQREGKPH